MMQVLMIGIVYHHDYNKYDLGTTHPLVGDKPKKTIEYLEKTGILHELTQFAPTKATDDDLLRVHAKQYVDKIKSLSKTGGMLAFDTPAPVGIYDIAALATGGTMLAGEKLFSGFDCMINPLAGFHHASSSTSSGFCFFNDIAVTIEYLRQKYQLQRFLIVDLDVHHCNGTQDIYYDDPTVMTISFHQDGRTLYPGTGAIDKIGRDVGEGYNVNLPLPPGTGNQSVRYAFHELIPSLGMQFNPQVIIYQSGVDTHHSDPLADLKLTYQIYYHLGKNMKTLSTKTCNKLLVAFGGGYNSDASVKSYYNLVCGLLGKREHITENEIADPNSQEVKALVNRIKTILKDHWNF